LQTRRLVKSFEGLNSSNTIGERVMALVRQLKTASLGQFQSTNISYTGSQRVKDKSNQ